MPRYYKQIMQDAGKRMAKLRREHEPEQLVEVYEAWLTAGLAGLIEIKGWAYVWNLVCHKMGNFPPPRTRPSLAVDNTKGAA